MEQKCLEQYSFLYNILMADEYHYIIHQDFQIKGHKINGNVNDGLSVILKGLCSINLSFIFCKLDAK